MKKKVLSSLIAGAVLAGNFAACSTEVNETTAASGTSAEATTATTTNEVLEPTEEVPTEPELDLPSVNPNFEGLSASEICALLTLEEKASQMVQGAYYNLSSNDMKENCYGSVLSYGYPCNTHDVWMEVVREYQMAALSNGTAIPYIYGNDFLHGVNVGFGATIFPHNINLGAANNPELMYEMGVITGSNMLYTGNLWNFSPCVAVAKDPRWGRTYESYSSDSSIVTSLSVEYVKGMLTQAGIVPCAKHFFADGSTEFGTGEQLDGQVRLIDRGDAVIDDSEIAELLSVYQALIDENVPSIMLSHSALNGVKMHENSEYIEYLRHVMGFEGVILSDWDSIHNCSGSSLKENVILSINAGVDMLMEAGNFEECRDYIVEAVNEGLIPMERIDDAVTRIIQMKLDCGLFEDPYLYNIEPSYDWNSDYEHEVARELATESMVPLKLPDGGEIVLEAGMKVFVSGPAADDSGVLCGGWTYEWQGSVDPYAGARWCDQGPTILEAITEAGNEIGFEVITDAMSIDECDVAILCVGEIPYAEWYGDADDISLTGPLALNNEPYINKVANSDIPVITLIVAGRNVIIDEYVDNWDEVIMCYLPGSEGGNAVADLLTGKAEFSGHLPMPYYYSENQIGTGAYWLPAGYSAADQ
ncbi:MAG: glycoside hydrolase family 3 C-terminal domain-containing protein [Clostridia bacterium]|nr:glycoside hydrolase family 3 C-terminal domain-containing protein [Clostridia bacterium]